VTVRVFLDASVLFAACYSSTGSSRDLLLRAIEGEIQLILSEHVLMEVERNLAQKAPEALSVFQTLVDLVAPEVVGNPSLEELQRAAAYTELKDAPIVAAATKAGADYLTTWDRRHLIDDPMVAEQSGLRITTPDELIDIIIGEDS
jgi:predicted nucleic acid-binding protein